MYDTNINFKQLTSAMVLGSLFFNEEIVLYFKIIHDNKLLKNEISAKQKVTQC